MSLLWEHEHSLFCEARLDLNELVDRDLILSSVVRENDSLDELDLLDTSTVKFLDCRRDDDFKIVFLIDGVLMIECFYKNLMRGVRAEKVFKNSVAVTAESVPCELFGDPASKATFAKLIENLLSLFI